MRDLLWCSDVLFVRIPNLYKVEFNHLLWSTFNQPMRHIITRENCKINLHNNKIYCICLYPNIHSPFLIGLNAGRDFQQCWKSSVLLQRICALPVRYITFRVRSWIKVVIWVCCTMLKVNPNIQQVESVFFDQHS